MTDTLLLTCKLIWLILIQSILCGIAPYTNQRATSIFEVLQDLKIFLMSKWVRGIFLLPGCRAEPTSSFFRLTALSNNCRARALPSGPLKAWVAPTFFKAQTLSGIGTDASISFNFTALNSALSGHSNSTSLSAISAYMKFKDLDLHLQS